MLTMEFRRHLFTYIPLDMLLTMKVLSKEFEVTMREYIARRVEGGRMIFHHGVDIIFDPYNGSEEETMAFVNAAKKRNKLVTQVVFLQNLPQIGYRACLYAVNLVVVNIPEGVERIGKGAFWGCSSLTTVYFPPSLTSIGEYALEMCVSLDNVDLLHTNLQELGQTAFGGCGELKSMTIPDSLQTLGAGVFRDCSKLVPSNIEPYRTPSVVAHLRSKQQSVELDILNVVFAEVL